MHTVKHSSFEIYALAGAHMCQACGTWTLSDCVTCQACNEPKVVDVYTALVSGSLLVMAPVTAVDTSGHTVTRSEVSPVLTHPEPTIGSLTKHCVAAIEMSYEKHRRNDGNSDRV